MADGNKEHRTDAKWQDTFPDWSKHSIVIPLEVLARTDISAGAKLMYGLARYLSWRNGNGDAEVSVQDAADMIGAPKRSAERYIAELRGPEVGLLTSKRRGLGLTNAYTVHPPTQNRGDGYANMAEPEGTDLADPHACASKDLQTKGINRKAIKTLAPAARERVPKLQRIDGRDLAMDALSEETNADQGARGSELAGALQGRGNLFGIRQMFWEDCCDRFGEEAMLDATSEEFETALANSVRFRAAAYRQVMNGAMLTPTALRKWWRDAPKLAQQGGTSWDDYIKHGPKERTHDNHS